MDDEFYTHLHLSAGNEQGEVFGGQKQYKSNHFQGDFEIVSLTGTINTMDDEFYTHLHLSAGNEQGEVFGGHLNRAIVSATCEMIVQVIDGRVDRKFDEDTGLNLFDF